MKPTLRDVGGEAEAEQDLVEEVVAAEHSRDCGHHRHRLGLVGGLMQLGGKKCLEPQILGKVEAATTLLFSPSSTHKGCTDLLSSSPV